MEHELSREDTYIRNIEQINALVDYVRRAGLNTLTEYQKDKMLNLSTRQSMVITTVHLLTKQSGKGVALSNLARELHMSVSATSHLVDTLVEHRILVRESDEEDRRCVRISLSPCGLKCAATARQGMLRSIFALTAQLSPEEEEMRLHIIDKLYHLVYPNAQ